MTLIVVVWRYVGHFAIVNVKAFLVLVTAFKSNSSTRKLKVKSSLINVLYLLGEGKGLVVKRQPNLPIMYT